MNFMNPEILGTFSDKVLMTSGFIMYGHQPLFHHISSMINRSHRNPAVYELIIPLSRSACIRSACITSTTETTTATSTSQSSSTTSSSSTLGGLGRGSWDVMGFATDFEMEDMEGLKVVFVNFMGG